MNELEAVTASAAEAATAAAGGDWPAGLVFHESVQELLVSGAIAAICEVPPCPTVLCDQVYAPSGAMTLPDDETAVAPSSIGAYEVRIATDLAGEVPDEKAVQELAALTEPALIERARGTGGGGGGAAALIPYAAPGAKPTSFDLIASMVTHRALNECGVPPRFHHLVRRRIWGVAPGTCLRVRVRVRRCTCESRCSSACVCGCPQGPVRRCRSWTCSTTPTACGASWCSPARASSAW